MKKILLILVFYLTSFMSFAQTIHSLNVAPNGTDSIDVNLETFISTTPSYYLEHTYNITSGVINLQVCFFSGNGQVPTLLNNTFSIPVNSPIDYTLNIAIYRSVDPNTCDYTELTDTATLQFTTPLTETVYLGVEYFELIANQINMHPNPVKDFLNITVTNTITVNSIEIYNIIGVKIKTYSNDFESLDVSNLISGMYFLKFNTNRGIIQKRILVSN